MSPKPLEALAMRWGSDRTANGASFTRRRAIRIVAAAAGLPLMIAAVRASAPPPQMFHWQGSVLDAVSELTLWHTDAARARRSILRMEAEIARYERIFSLFRPDSEISRLNATGALTNPAPELRALIEQSQRFSVISGGAFDISVQPLWQLYEAHFWSHTQVVPDIVARAQEVARELVDFRRIETGARRIAFARQGMGITLNSVAQGFITDAIADMLRNEGFEQAVVDLGEFRVLGRHPDGHAWRIGIQNALTPTEVGRVIELDDTALAVSGGYGTTFEPTGRFNHIFDPQTGASADKLADAAVIGPRATAANALAVAVCVVGEERGRALLEAAAGYRAIVTRSDGMSMTIG
jgi:thiamine biosynthesis lipoprotein